MLIHTETSLRNFQFWGGGADTAKYLSFSQLDIMKAIKAGFVTKSTKAELERLEEEQERIEIEIAKEQIVRPIIS